METESQRGKRKNNINLLLTLAVIGPVQLYCKVMKLCKFMRCWRNLLCDGRQRKINTAITDIIMAYANTPVFTSFPLFLFPFLNYFFFFLIFTYSIGQSHFLRLEMSPSLFFKSWRWLLPWEQILAAGCASNIQTIERWEKMLRE